MKKHMLCALAVLFTTSASVLANDVIETRQANFKQNGQTLKAVRTQIAAGDLQAIAEGAEKIAQWAEKMPDFFPQGATSKGARPAIWENFEDFKAKAQANQSAALGLKEAALSGDSAVVMDALGTLGASCKSCHSSYKAD